MEEIRTLKEEELNECIALQTFALQYSFSLEQLEVRKKRMKPEDNWGYFVDGKLASKLTLLSMQTFICKKTFQVGGIISVATWPEFRRNGMVGRLLETSLRVMKEKGYTLSFLHPFSYPFYSKYGWQHYVDYKRYEVSTSNFTNIDSSDCFIRRVGKDDAWPLLNGIYEAYAIRFNGMVKRDEVWWKRVFELKNGQIVVIYNANSELSGYIIYEVKQNKIMVHEMIFNDEESRRGLLRFIGNHDSMAETVIIDAPVNDLMPLLLQNPKIKQEIIPYAMARIVDVSSFISEYVFESDEKEETVHFFIEDLFAPWNQGDFLIRLSTSGNASIEHWNVSGAQEAEIRCDIQTFTAMMLGSQRPMNLYEMGKIHGEKGKIFLLENRIPRYETYLTDYF